MGCIFFSSVLMLNDSGELISMAVKDIFKVNFKTFFNPVGWLGYNQLRDSTRTIRDVLKSLLETPTSTRIETFDEAMKRMNIDEADLGEIVQRYLIFSLVFLLIGSLAIGASFYLLFGYKTFAGFLLAIAAGALLLSQAFRYHFWYFQIVNRKLGCTFDEWWRGQVNPDRDAKP